MEKKVVEMLTWVDRKLVRKDVSDKHLYIAHSGSGHTVFAEEVEFDHYTKLHLVWKMKNGKTFKTTERGYGVGKNEGLFILVRDEELQFCDRDKGIKTNYIHGVFVY